jgi:hypothetical protein
VRDTKQSTGNLSLPLKKKTQEEKLEIYLSVIFRGKRRKVSDANDNLLTDRTPVCVSRFKFRPAPFKREINKYISNQRYRTLFLLCLGHMSLRGKKRNSLERSSSSSDHPIRSVGRARNKNSEICFFVAHLPATKKVKRKIISRGIVGQQFVERLLPPYR